MDQSTSTNRKFRHARAVAYDSAFEERLLERTVVTESMVDDGAGKPVLVLRSAATAGALVGVLASVLALSPQAAHSGDAIKQTSRSFRRKLQSQVRQATRDPHLHDFLRRTFNHTDRTREGRA